MRRMASLRFGILATVGALTLGAGVEPTAAYAQVSSREAIQLQNQIDQINQQMSQIRQGAGAPAPVSPAPASSSGANGDLVAQLLDRVSHLEAQVRDMRGELDELHNTVQTQNAALSKKVDDMQFAAGGSAPSGSDSAAAQPSPAPASTAPRSASDLLADGRGALRAHNYAQAQSDAQQALKSAKSSQGKMDAQFLLAQSLAGQKQYKDSALAYYDAYKRLPHSARAPEALLGVSASMLALGDKTSACQALDQLKSEFPSSAPRVKSAAASFRKRAGCS